MSVKRFALERVEAFDRELARLCEIEFPYEDSLAALKDLRVAFQEKAETLRRLPRGVDPSVEKQLSTLTLRALFECLPLAGFLLRSTNIRNAFEVVGPLLRLINGVVNPTEDASRMPLHLVVSSEWDYSPLTYGHLDRLPGYVLIGLPAPESSNPLLLPLAGHEFGHPIWHFRDLEKEFLPVLKSAVVEAIRGRWSEYRQTFPLLDHVKPGDLTTDMFALESWEKALRWTLSQAEETFCDCLGLLLFGESFLLAFAYLSSPEMASRSVAYPSTWVRARNLAALARERNINVPKGYLGYFSQEDPVGFIPGDEFRLKVADASLENSLKTIRAKAIEIRDTSALPPHSVTEERRILECFRKAVPASGCRSLADLLNAGWSAYNDRTLWRDTPHLAKRRDAVLKEVVLKSIEVFEIERRQEESRP